MNRSGRAVIGAKACAKSGIVALALLAGCSGHRSGGSTIDYVSGVTGPEDMVAVPGTKWLITSGLKTDKQPGALWLIDSETMSAVQLLGPQHPVAATDTSPDLTCTTPIDPLRFSAHGINLAVDKHGAGKLLVVNHGEREAIEIFSIDTAQIAPQIVWTGCIKLPVGALGNGVTALTDNNIAATLMNAPEYFTGPADAGHPENWVPRLSSGQTTGYAATWRPGEGWKKIPGTEGSGPNGIETSPDGLSVWVALWGNRRIVRAPLTAGMAGSSFSVDFMPDNLRWGDDGMLWAAGAATAPSAYFKCWATPGCRNDFAIAKIDPAKMLLMKVPHPATLPKFGDVTTAVMRQGEVWLAANPSDKVAVMRAAKK